MTRSKSIDPVTRVAITRALSIPLAPKWTVKTDGQGWTTHTRGNARITVPPSGVDIMFNYSGVTTYHANVDAAKRAAARTPNRGW